MLRLGQSSRVTPQQKTETHVSQAAFSDLELTEDLLQSLSSLSYKEMTPIQSQMLPLALSGKDVIAQAKTGSGKTVSFGLVALQNLNAKQFDTQSLVLCPTRELADQVAEEIRALARATHNVKVLTLTGGSSLRPQIESLAKGAHVVVGTPGRIEDHLDRGTVKLDNVNTFVLDEADRMLQMGFQESIDNIVKYIPATRQTLLLSATYPEEIKTIAHAVMTSPEMVVVDATHNNEQIQQHFYRIDKQQDRLQALQLLLMKYCPESALVFCNTKISVRDVTSFLKDKGFAAIAMHGDLDQKDRDQNLIRFTNRSATVMVATDVAARGLDIEKLDVVVNYELSKDVEVHVHRSGRTGRAGETGQVWTLFDNSDKHRLEQLGKVLNKKIKDFSLPSSHVLKSQPPRPATVTLEINAGKKQKLRPGDILGALTGDAGLQGSAVGKIKIFSSRSFVAVDRSSVKKALSGLLKIKGRSFRVRAI